MINLILVYLASEEVKSYNQACERKKDLARRLRELKDLTLKI